MCKIKSSFVKIKYMFYTINDFKNFFDGTNKIVEITLFELVNKNLHLLELDLKNNSIELKLNFREKNKNVPILIDEAKLNQVLINLIKNSIDAIIEKNSIERKIELYVYCENEYLIIFIEDTGGGIPHGLLDTIFEHNFTTKNENGTGLGLYMCKMIIQDYFNGKLKVENILKGARFIIKVPIRGVNV